MTSTFALSQRLAVVRVWGSRVGMFVVLFLLACVMWRVDNAAAAKTVVGVVGAFTDQNGSGEGEFSGAAGVAVNENSGDVYVVDANNDRVQRFAADGTFISQFGVSGSGEGEFLFFGELAGIAVDQADGSVYVADTNNQRIQKFTADGTFVHTFGLGVDPGGDPDFPVFEICTAGSGCQSGNAGSGDGELWSPIAVAVDPNDGDVLVADRDNFRIQRFDSSGAYESQFPISLTAFRIAIDSTSAIYVLEYQSQIHKFDAAGNFVDTFAPAPVNAPEEIATAGDHVFVGQLAGSPNPVVLEFDPTLDPADQLLDTHTAVVDSPTREIKGLAVNADGPIYLNVNFENTAGDRATRVFILDDTGIPPATVTLLPASEVEATSATLNAEINSNGGLPTDYRLEISPDGTNWTVVDTSAVPGGTTNTPIFANATGLRPNTLYRFRIVTNKGFGSPDLTSPEQTFVTDPVAPEIVQAHATSVDATSATLQGRINPHSSPTRYRFDYGVGAFNRSIPIPDAAIGSSPDPVFVSQALNNLRPNTTYQFRLVAISDAGGTTTGPTQTFTTTPRPPERRAYELVSPAYKIGGVGAGIWYAGPAASATVGTPAYDGERFIVKGDRGSTVSDGPIAYGEDWSFAERTPQGWVNRPGMSRRAHGNQLFATAQLQESTDDLSLTAFSSNSHYLRLFPEMESWEEEGGGRTALLVRDWTSDWELVAPLEPTQAISGIKTVGHAAKAFADNGSLLAFSTPGIRGLTDGGDPTSPSWPDPELLCSPRDPGSPNEVCASSVYIDEIDRPLGGAFPGDDRVRELVNVCTGTGANRTQRPAGPCPPDTGEGFPRLISPGGASLTPGSAGAVSPSPRVVSADGMRIFFMTPDPDPISPGASAGVSQIYVRQRNPDTCGLTPSDPDDGCVVTQWISRTEVAGQSSALVGPAIFEGASRDGDKVFFRTTSPLTRDDPNGQGVTPPAGGVVDGDPSFDSADLYMYDMPETDDPAGGTLTRISAGPDGGGDCNSPLAQGGLGDFDQRGAMRFASDDGSRVYFVCAAPLQGVSSAAGTVTSPGGTQSSADTSNLYLYDANRPVAERWTFIARLPRGTTGLRACATTSTGNDSVMVAGAGATTANIPAATGNCFSGSTDGSLVTFFTDGRLTADDPDSTTGDIYAYDATRNELVRITAPQGGAGGTYDCAPGRPDLPQCFGDGGISPQDYRALRRLGVATRPNGDKLAFFESRSRLVPEDTDDAYDVYQWQDGDLSLISTGASETDGAFYVGNDRSGLNVYIATRDRLSWQDGDAVMDVYTARVDGGIPEPPPPVVCASLADSCQGAGAGPVSTGSVTSSPVSSGNIVSKRKTLALSGLRAKALRRAARTGKLVLSVRTSAPGMLRVTASTRIAGRRVKIAGRHKPSARPGVVRLALSLSARARNVLRTGRGLRVTLRVGQTGARTASTTVTLKRGKR